MWVAVGQPNQLTSILIIIKPVTPENLSEGLEGLAGGRPIKNKGGLPKRSILRKWKCSCRLIFLLV
jgi:hypothetical protein